MQKVVNGNGKAVHRIVHGPRNVGQRAADGIAKWAGSWMFIILFLFTLVVWMLLNTTMVLLGKWDVYPFILLNLVLSCIAALQAPVILMSQNRQSQKDRTKVEYDYKVNRKAEKNIEKILKKLAAIEGRVVRKK